MYSRDKTTLLLQILVNFTRLKKYFKTFALRNDDGTEEKIYGKLLSGGSRLHDGTWKKEADARAG